MLEEESETFIARDDSMANFLPSNPSHLERTKNNDDKIYDEKCYKIIAYARYILPHFILFCSLIFYIILGAAYFYYHESSFEVESEFFEFRKTFYDKIWTLKHSTSDKTNDNFVKIHQTLFDDLISHISRLQSSGYVTKKDLIFNESKNENELLWSFSNSMFFTTTILMVTVVVDLHLQHIGGK